MIQIRNILISLILIGLAGCGLVYEQDIQQGNVVTDEMLNNLRLGMSKTEVKYYLGTPLLEDPFHHNRWDYYYTFREGGDDQRQQQLITILFTNTDTLADITGTAQTSMTDVNEIELPADGKLNPVVNEVEGEVVFWERIKSRVLGQ